jgi:hypothetical protein
MIRETDPCTFAPGATLVFAGTATSCSSRLAARATNILDIKGASVSSERGTSLNVAETGTITEAHPAKRTLHIRDEACQTKVEDCSASYERDPNRILWDGMPRRNDTAGSSFDDWAFLNEVGAVTNAIMGLVTVRKESGNTNNVYVDTLLDE